MNRRHHADIECLIEMNRLAKLSMSEFMEEAWGFVWMALLVVVLICLFPGLVTFVPNLLMGASH